MVLSATIALSRSWNRFIKRVAAAAETPYMNTTHCCCTTNRRIHFLDAVVLSSPKEGVLPILHYSWYCNKAIPSGGSDLKRHRECDIVNLRTYCSLTINTKGKSVQQQRCKYLHAGRVGYLPFRLSHSGHMPYPSSPPCYNRNKLS